MRQAITATSAITEFAFSAETSSSGTSLSTSEYCSINMDAAANCTAEYVLSAHGTKTSVTTTKYYASPAVETAHV